MGINAIKWLYEGVIVPTGMYGVKAWATKNVERRKVNVLEMKCLGSLVGFHEKRSWVWKKRSPYGLSLPNQNTIIINIICLYFIRFGKFSIKFY